MKKITLITIIFIALFNITKAQSSCDDITKTIDKTDKEITYSSPSGNNISVQKNIYPDGTRYTRLYFYVQTASPDYSDNQTCYITFDDGTIFNFTSSNMRIKAADHLYLYTCGYSGINEDFKQFQQKRIVKFQLAGKETTVGDWLSGKVISWLNCIADMK